MNQFFFFYNRHTLLKSKNLKELNTFEPLKKRKREKRLKIFQKSCAKSLTSNLKTAKNESPSPTPSPLLNLTIKGRNERDAANSQGDPLF